jgi:hypothetical protein
MRPGEPGPSRTAIGSAARARQRPLRRASSFLPEHPRRDGPHDSVHRLSPAGTAARLVAHKSRVGSGGRGGDGARARPPMGQPPPRPSCSPPFPGPAGAGAIQPMPPAACASMGRGDGHERRADVPAGRAAQALAVTAGPGADVGAFAGAALPGESAARSAPATISVPNDGGRYPPLRRMVPGRGRVCLPPPVLYVPAHWRAATPICENWVDGPQRRAAAGHDQGLPGR